MKKLTAGIFATLLAVVSADGAYAAIASKGYVDDKVGEVQTAVTEVEGDVSTLQTTVAGKADSSTVTTLAGRVTTAEGEIDALQSEVKGKQDALGFTPENSANKTTTLSGTSTNAQYPSAKAVWDTIQAETEGIASSGDLSALGTRVTTAEGEIDTLQTQMAGKQDKLSQTGSASQPVYVNAEGKVTAGNTIPTVTTSITTGQTGAAQAGAVADALADKANTADLGALAKLNAVASAQITDGAVATADIANKAVTKEKLADEIVTSLGKADTALQQASLNGYLTKTAADAAYADIATETTAQTALTRIGTLTDLTTEAKTNTVAAINEVAGEASDAQTTATAAQKTANAAIPAPTAACAEPENKCVLVSSGAGNYSWEVIARNGEGQ